MTPITKDYRPMNQLVSYLLVAFFSIFVGSQLTEGVILVPYWQSLSAEAFYSYYNTFGPGLGKFYTVLTIIAALIPILLAVYCYRKQSGALKLALISTFFALLFVACFYVYFKGANQLFYDRSLSEQELEQGLSLLFLILSLRKINRAAS